jgi:aryl carrier-like protein
MVPATFTAVDALPLSPTGKIDRSKLPLPPEIDAPHPPRATSNSLEDTLLDIWRTVLGNHNAGVDDNFFDLGGTSLQLMQVHARITSVMQQDLTLLDLFRYPCISALAAHLRPLRSAAPLAGTALAETQIPLGPASGHQATSPMDAHERARRQRAAISRARDNNRQVR